MAADTGANEVQDLADDARDSEAVTLSARLGFALYALLYFVVAWLTVQLAVGDHPDKVSGKGAMHELAQQPAGGPVLWLLGVGFAALVVWDVCRALARDKEPTERLAPACRAVVFATLCVLTVQVELTGKDDHGTSGITAKLLRLPFGPWLVAAVGLGVLGFGCWSVFKGFTERWRREIDLDGQAGTSGTVLKVLARLGYVTRGLAYAGVGAFFCWAAWTHDPKKSAGLDQALSRLRAAPYGPWVLVLAAVGFACWALFQAGKVAWLKQRS